MDPRPVARARQNRRPAGRSATAWRGCHGNGVCMLDHRTGPPGPAFSRAHCNRDAITMPSHRRLSLRHRPRRKAPPPCRPASPGARSSPAASSPSRSGPCSTSSASRSAPARWMRPAGSTPGASSFGIGAGIWLLVANLIGLAVGGYVAARLSGTADSTDSVLHGLSVWAHRLPALGGAAGQRHRRHRQHRGAGRRLAARRRRPGRRQRRLGRGRPGRPGDAAGGPEGRWSTAPRRRCAPAATRRR